MAPISLILAAALLGATAVVDARTDKVRVDQWVDTACEGHVSAKSLEIKTGKCENINAQSIKAHLPKKDKHAKWVADVNSGDLLCFVTVYNTTGCPEATDVDPQHLGYLEESVPANFETCRHYSTSVIRSVKFQCQSRKFIDIPDPTTIVEPVTLTSYSIDSGNTPHAVPFTTTVTSTRTFLHRLEPRTTPTKVPRNVAGEKFDAKGVWIKHPWTGSTVCFECWRPKYNNLQKFRCESGPGIAADCGEAIGVPTQVSTTHVATVTATTTKPAFFGRNEPLEPRSERKTVALKNPFTDEDVCAKAKWKHPGKDNQKVIIKGPKDCGDDGGFPIATARETQFLDTYTTTTNTITVSPVTFVVTATTTLTTVATSTTVA